MADEPKPLTFQGTGTTQNASQSAEQGTQAGPKYVTEETLQKAIQGVTQDIAKMVQSTSDKAQSRIEKKIQQRLDVFTETAKAIGMDEAALEAARQKIVLNAYAEREQEQSSQEVQQRQTVQSAPQPDNQQNAISPEQAALNQFINDQADVHGVMVEENDPEAAAVKEAKDLKEFKRLYAKAAQEKAARLAASPQSRIATLGVGSATSLEEAYKAENAKIPRGQASIQARIDLKNKYRKLGYEPD